MRFGCPPKYVIVIRLTRLVYSVHKSTRFVAEAWIMHAPSQPLVSSLQLTCSPASRAVPWGGPVNQGNCPGPCALGAPRTGPLASCSSRLPPPIPLLQLLTIPSPPWAPHTPRVDSACKTQSLIMREIPMSILKFVLLQSHI